LRVMPCTESPACPAPRGRGRPAGRVESTRGGQNMRNSSLVACTPGKRIGKTGSGAEDRQGVPPPTFSGGGGAKRWCSLRPGAILHRTSTQIRRGGNAMGTMRACLGAGFEGTNGSSIPRRLWGHRWGGARAYAPAKVTSSQSVHSEGTARSLPAVGWPGPFPSFGWDGLLLCRSRGRANRGGGRVRESRLALRGNPGGEI